MGLFSHESIARSELANKLQGNLAKSVEVRNLYFSQAPSSVATFFKPQALHAMPIMQLCTCTAIHTCISAELRISHAVHDVCMNTSHNRFMHASCITWYAGHSYSHYLF